MTRRSSLAFDSFDSRPVLVLLHAFPLDRRMWHKQGEALAGQARVLAIDLPGFGESPMAPGLPSLDAFADQVEELLAMVVGRSKVVMLGLSMGGYVALRIAERHPDRLTGLVLADTRAAADSEVARVGRDQAIERVRTDGVASLVDSLLPRLLSEEPDAETAAHVRGLIEQQTPDAVCAALAAMRDRPDSTKVLQALSLPTMVVVGAQDVLVPPEEASALAGALAGAELVTVAGAGHLSSLENPDVFNQAVSSFLAQL